MALQNNKLHYNITEIPSFEDIQQQMKCIVPVTRRETNEKIQILAFHSSSSKKEKFRKETSINPGNIDNSGLEKYIF